MSTVAQQASVTGVRYRNSRAMVRAGMPAGAFAYFTTSSRPGPAELTGMFIACPGCRNLMSVRFQPFREPKVIPRHPHAPGNGWTWNGLRDQPTLTPKIICRDRACNWRGWLRGGEFVQA